MPEVNHPLQPVIVDDEGIIRFKENAIVIFLIGQCQRHKIADMNTLATLPFSPEDRAQFAQLIGYSVSGFGDLSYVPRRLVDAADRQAAKLMN